MTTSLQIDTIDVNQLRLQSPDELIVLWQYCHVKPEYESVQSLKKRLDIWVACCRELRKRGYYLDVTGKRWTSIMIASDDMTPLYIDSQ